jgi:hypothetical protein
VSWRTACPVCGRSQRASRCPHQDSFVTDVDVEEVDEQVVALVAGRPRG